MCARLIGSEPVRDSKSGEVRPCRAGDIALLAPTGSELWRYEEALEQHGTHCSSRLRSPHEAASTYPSSGLLPRRRCTGTGPARKSDRAAPNGSRSRLVDVRSHDLSHSVASGGLLVVEGLPMIGKLLGNTQVQTTERYAYLANDPVKAAANRIASRIADIAGLSATLRSAGRCRSFSACEQGALGGLLHYLIVFSMNPSVLAFSIKVRTFARSRPDGTSASISSFRVTSLPGRVASCSTTASTI